MNNIFAEIIDKGLHFYYGFVCAIAVIGIVYTIIGFPKEQENIDHYIVLPEQVITPSLR